MSDDLDLTYRFAAHVFLHQGDTGWHFLTLPTEVADEIDLLTEETRRGFGSVKVRVTIGATTWATSIFPDASSESFVLPVKKPVRTAEGIEDGDEVDVILELVDLPPMLA
jgi:hypothetical protein